MRGFTVRGVYHHAPRRVAEADPEGKFIGVRWVAENEGTKEVPKVRTRLVGQEFAHGQRRDDLHAPTPPLAAAWYLLCTCASRANKFLATTAYCCWTSERLSISRTVRIGLPSEDPMSEGENMVGKLGKAHVRDERCFCGVAGGVGEDYG